ncbi:MAG: hypothetical protein M5R36_21970 [Deltaproteobacteria bacterium]|nr:hypothetical protein [Deltaproteobacteria bacterium]
MNSGTTMRLLAGILAGAGTKVTLTGDASLSRRPMERVAAPLRELGADIETTGGRPPLHIVSGATRSASIELPIASAQLKSAVLLCGLFLDGTTTVSEPAQSRDHTERMFRFTGVPFSAERQNRCDRRPGAPASVHHDRRRRPVVRGLSRGDRRSRPGIARRRPRRLAQRNASRFFPRSASDGRTRPI